MPFDSNGNYSLPNIYLAENGQTIQPSQHNTPLEDIASGLSNALLRSGVAPMGGPLRIAAGTVSAPSLAFANAPTWGFYRTPTGFGVAINATKVAEFAPDGMVTGAFPSGTAMLFVQTAAPTGWTKSTTHNNKALRIVSGTTSSGGSLSFTTAFGARTIAQANLPNVNFTVTIPAGQGSHSHAGDAVSGGTGGSGPASAYDVVTHGAIPAATLPAMSGTAASGGSGTAMDFAVQYVDVIMATKD